MNTDTWRLAQASLKFFLVKFLKLKWFDHYNEWEYHVLNSPRSDHQAHRGSGKSVFWSLGVPLWDVIRGPTEGVEPEDIIISYSEDQARDLIRKIRVEVESNPFLEPLRPTTKEIWGTDKLSFPNKYSISAIGFGTSSRGRHPRRIIPDDPLKDIGGMSKEDQERAFFGVISGMAMEKTQIHVVGTPIAFDDLFEQLAKNEAYVHTKHPCYKKDGSIQCPELFTKELLEMKRKEMGSINFAREMLLQRIDPATQPFKRQYETLYQSMPEGMRWARKVTVCDPAYSENDGDYTAIVTVGFTHGNQAWVLEAKGIRREDPGEVVTELVKTLMHQKPDVLGVEKRKGQALEYSLREAIARYQLFDFKYVELQHHGQAKWSDNRIGGLVGRWEARSIHIHPDMGLLRAQIYAYRVDDKSKEHDDLVDALAYCFHPDLVKPNSGMQNVPLDSEAASMEGRPRYQVGQGQTWRPKQVYEWASNSRDYGPRWAMALDKRVSDAA